MQADFLSQVKFSKNKIPKASQVKFIDCVCHTENLKGRQERERKNVH